MSYDLFLRREKPVSLEEFTAYFSGRANYTCENGQAFYQNEATGVYFPFDLTKQPQQDDDEPCAVAFNLNYYRPHFFALEAAPEVSAAIEHFGFEITDNQSDGMGEGPFSVEGFLRGWNHGNEFAYSAILNSENAPTEIHARATAELEGIWRWNFEKEKIQASMGEGVFVPRIFWVMLDGREHSAIAWPDAIPALIPQVDLLVVGRDELAPRKFFRKVKGNCLLPREQAADLLAPLKKKSWALPAHYPGYEVAPPHLRQFIQGLSSSNQPISGLAMDAVLNRELVERYRKKN